MTDRQKSFNVFFSIINNLTTPGTEDYLINGHNGFVSDNNFKSFSTNVETLIKNENIRKLYGKNARKTIEHIGSRKDNMKKLLDYFMGIIKWYIKSMIF